MPARTSVLAEAIEPSAVAALTPANALIGTMVPSEDVADTPLRVSPSPAEITPTDDVLEVPASATEVPERAVPVENVADGPVSKTDDPDVREPSVAVADDPTNASDMPETPDPGELVAETPARLIETFCVEVTVPTDVAADTPASAIDTAGDVLLTRVTEGSAHRPFCPLVIDALLDEACAIRRVAPLGTVTVTLDVPAKPDAAFIPSRYVYD
jgi:hypothetical protein